MIIFLALRREMEAEKPHKRKMKEIILTYTGLKMLSWGKRRMDSGAIRSIRSKVLQRGMTIKRVNVR